MYSRNIIFSVTPPGTKLLFRADDHRSVVGCAVSPFPTDDTTSYDALIRDETVSARTHKMMDTLVRESAMLQTLCHSMKALEIEKVIARKKQMITQVPDRLRDDVGYNNVAMPMDNDSKLVDIVCI